MRENEGSQTADTAEGYRPLGKKATVAITVVSAYTACSTISAWRNIAYLAAGPPHLDQDLTGFDALYMLVFIIAAWAVIRWTDAAQDNLPALDNPPLQDRLEAVEWIIPGLNVVAPYFGVALLSKQSNPDHGLDSTEGPMLASIRPWWLLWAPAVALNVMISPSLWLMGMDSPKLDAWLTAVSGLLQVAAAPFLVHVIAATSRQQDERHRGLSNPWR